MRPHLLEFTAIGSYPGSVTVDFDALAPQGLFHIHGPTGAGKSSLIDAMCFALYGTIPPPRRADGLRSHHANPKTEAVVRFEFSAQGQTWKIIRTPTQLRAKLRGDGTTEQRATATLQRKEGGGWATVSSGPKEVDPIIQKLLGLDAEQFMQVVVLPQGGFQRVLRAGADEREDLLRHLFGSERFKLYTQRLKERSDNLKHRVDAQVHSQQSAATRVAAGLAEFDIAIDNFPDHIDDPIIEQVRKGSEQAKVSAAELKKAADEAGEAAGRAEVVARRVQNLYKRWQTKVGAMSSLASLEEQRSDIEAIRNELRGAEKAAPLAPLHAAVEEAKRQFISATTARQVAQSAIRSKLTSDLVGESDICFALSQLVDVVPTDAQIDTVRKQLRTRQQSIQVAADQARQTVSTREDVDHFIKSLPFPKLTLEQLQLEIDARESDMERQQAKLAELQTVASRGDALRLELEQLQRAIDAANAYRNEQKRTAEIRNRLDEVRSEAEAASTKHLSLLERRIKSMAGELASKLTDGEPCVVCGSQEHPAPATWVDIVSDEEIAAAAQLKDELTSRVRVSEQSLSEATEREAAYAAAAGDVLENRASAYSQKENLEEQIAVATSAEKQIKEVEATIQDLKVRTQRLQNDLAKTTEQIVSLTSRLEDAKKRLAELEAAIDKQGGMHVLEIADALEETFESVDVLASTIEQERMRNEAWDAAQRRLTEQAEASGVEDVVDALAYLRNQEQLQMLRERVKRWEHAKAVAESHLDDPTIAVMEEEPDVQAAESERTEAAARHKEALAAAARAEAQAAQLEASVTDLVAAYERFKPLIEEYERVHTLYELCHGGRSNTKRQSLERYILASYLEEVAEAASKRLHLMSSGRYSLRHSDARVRGNAASGLALLVTDAYTGQEREVSTLSGGETFLASLALALGLADVVQAKSGGVHIEALFIDEGFGSLDPEALELALAELDRLREGGRLVGVISHVQALRDRIPAGIEVVRGPAGSTIKQNNGLIAAS